MDRITPQQRSKNITAIRSTNNTAEIRFFCYLFPNVLLIGSVFYTAIGKFEREH